jgi:hypothetical protein
MSGFVSWATHGIKRGRLRWNRRRLIAALCAAAVLVVTATLYLILVSQTAAQGRHIQQLQADLSLIGRENEQLEVRIAWASTIESLKIRATALGFVLPEQVEFLRVPGD